MTFDLCSIFFAACGFKCCHIVSKTLSSFFPFPFGKSMAISWCKLFFRAIFDSPHKCLTCYSPPKLPDHIKVASSFTLLYIIVHVCLLSEFIARDWHLTGWVYLMHVGTPVAPLDCHRCSQMLVQSMSHRMVVWVWGRGT